MLKYAILFLLFALVMGGLGFWVVAGTVAFIAKGLFVVFLLLFIAAMINGK